MAKKEATEAVAVDPSATALYRVLHSITVGDQTYAAGKIAALTADEALRPLKAQYIRPV